MARFKGMCRHAWVKEKAQGIVCVKMLWISNMTAIKQTRIIQWFLHNVRLTHHAVLVIAVLVGIESRVFYSIGYSNGDCHDQHAVFEEGDVINFGSFYRSLWIGGLLNSTRIAWMRLFDLAKVRYRKYG